MEMILNTVRMVDHDQVREYAHGDEKSLMENLAIGILNPEDFKNLNLTPSLNIKLSSEFGEVIVRNNRDENIPQGIILMPVSIWANQLTGIKGKEPIYKNILVKVEPTRDPILTFQELISFIKK
ncbi:MAG: molybdopterin dinucleotide binding domain-containing protein [Promethearchaeota archaeon]